MSQAFLSAIKQCDTPPELLITTCSRLSTAVYDAAVIALQFMMTLLQGLPPLTFDHDRLVPPWSLVSRVLMHVLLAVLQTLTVPSKEQVASRLWLAPGAKQQSKMVSVCLGCEHHSCSCVLTSYTMRVPSRKVMSALLLPGKKLRLCAGPLPALRLCSGCCWLTFQTCRMPAVHDT
jgi:hypothetical protein